MIYYILVILSVIMFSVQFLLNGIYQKNAGSSFGATLFFTVATGIIGSLILFVINGCSLALTPFTVIMASFAAVNQILFTLFSLKALGTINLSLYSVFSMIGGMALPFAFGIIFYGERLTLAKIICFVLIIVAMSFTLDLKEKSKKKAVFYYAGIFVTNGLSGVISMLFANGGYEKATAADYSIISAIVSVVLSAVLFVYMSIKNWEKPKITVTKKVILVLVACAFLSNVANYILVLALEHIDGSLQYPIVTGGVMIGSTLIGYFTSNKPTKKDVISVAVAFVAMLALLLPI